MSDADRTGADPVQPYDAAVREVDLVLIAKYEARQSSSAGPLG
jgi:hypothetical protein